MIKNPVMPIGRYVILEGPDGVGKTTLMQKLAEQYATDDRFNGVLTVRQPGGSQLGEKIRELLFSHPEMHWQVAIKLFAASMLSSLHETVLPALIDGKLVIQDRCWLSTLCYQSFDLEIKESLLDRLETLHDELFRVYSIHEDLYDQFGSRIVLLRADEDNLDARKHEAVDQDNRWELSERQRHIRKMYRECSDSTLNYCSEDWFVSSWSNLRDPKALTEFARFVLVDANKPLDEVVHSVSHIIQDLIEKPQED